MKIEKPDLSAGKALDLNQSGKRRSNDVDFKSILDDSLKQSASLTSPSKNPQMSMITPLPEIAPIQNIGKNDGFHKIEGFLDIIDAYVKKLEDHDFTLKDLAPIIDKMGTENEAMAKFFDSLPDTEGLKQIANEALIISSLEITKFNRGDYLDNELERR